MSETWERPKWQDSAACLGYPPEWWFPDVGGGWDTDRARRVCYTCPVRQECLEYALAANEKFGIWGGHSITEIRRIRTARRGRR